jgi:spoIIIJ-associated protein
MNVVKEVAKSKDEALNLVLKKLNAQEKEVVYQFLENKGGFLKGTTYECTGFLKLDIIEDAQEFLKGILNAMGIDANIEVSIKDEITTLKIYSSNNPIIIGKNGQNLEALTTLVRLYVKNLANNGPRIMLDVEDYKDRQIKKLERLARNLAKEVMKTKISIEMDNMNSYERRIVHNVLSEFSNISTESVGEEPNRHIVIKYVD